MMLCIFISSFDPKKVGGVFPRANIWKHKKLMTQGTLSVQPQVVYRLVKHMGSRLQ